MSDTYIIMDGVRIKVVENGDADGTYSLAVNLEPTGASSEQVQGTAADGADAVGNPVQIGGVDGTGKSQALRTDGDGHSQIDVLSSALPADAATQTTLALVKAKTDNLDLAITTLRDALTAGNTLDDIVTALGSPTQEGGTVTADQGAAGAAAWPVSLADGADAAVGALADAIVAAGAAGSLSAKLRRATQALEDLKSLVVLAAGENHIGEVGGAAVRLTAALTRPANATPYTAKDVLAAATIAVTGTAAGVGGVVRLTVASHPLVTGQAVTVASVGGTTEANGNWIVGFTDATHVDLVGTVYANAWTSGGTIQPMITLLNAGRKVGGSVWLDKFRRITTDMNDIVAHKLWFYVSQPTQLADNAVFTLLNANTAKRAGYVILDAQATEGAGSDVTLAQNIVDRLHIICAAADTTIFVVDEVLTAYTPTSGATVDYYFAASCD